MKVLYSIEGLDEDFEGFNFGEGVVVGLEVE